MGENHTHYNYESPLREDAFLLDDSEKILRIEKSFRDIMLTLGLDMNDDSLAGTPKRVAKMFVKELFSGLKPMDNEHSSFDNKYNYGEMLIEKNITLYSTCEHHFLPIVGKAHVGYISNGKVIGLSKINRIVNNFSKRPQVQERLTIQIVREMQKNLKTQNVACIIDAKHLCVNSRGIKDTASSTITAEFGGEFKNKEVKENFLNYIQLGTIFH
ncbi:GTP cyclohydrolase I FolE [Ichthyobacterium seriolicida]|nr:GTP cyclohydrolase I FolE [Ichthyobacterium seriolicida]